MTEQTSLFMVRAWREGAGEEGFRARILIADLETDTAAISLSAATREEVINRLCEWLEEMTTP